MNPSPVTTSCRKGVLVDVVVEANFDAALRYVRSVEHRADRLEELVEQFHDFLRDHRSMDHLQLEIKRIVEDQCAQCRRPWEVDRDETGLPCCAWCGTPVDEASSA